MNKLTHLSVKTKLWLIAGIAIFSSLIMQGYSLLLERNQLIADRKAELQHIVDSAYSMLEAKADSEVTDLANIKSEILESIGSMRYDDGAGYIWINDLETRMVMHPIKPELAGKDMSQFVDAEGFPLFRVVVDEVKKHGHAFIEYHWEKPGENSASPKLSYVKGFEPFGWVLGTGVYTDDINALFWSHASKTFILNGILLAVVITLVRLISRDIENTLQHMLSKMKLIQNGELTTRLENAERGDEFGELSLSINALTESLSHTLEHMKSSASALNENAAQMSQISHSTDVAIKQQFAETECLATAMEEMSNTIRQVSENASETSRSTTEADVRITAGQQNMQSSLRQVKELAAHLSNSRNVMQTLEEHSRKIVTVLDVIRGISEQTNLLALNAAIEAARAGESGRGFAVVADEVRSLAQKTQTSTEEIQKTTEQLQSGTNDAVNVMARCLEASEACLAQSELSSSELEMVVREVTHIKAMNEQIADAAHQQTIVTDEVARNVTQLRDLSSGMLESSKSNATQGESLESMAAELQNLVQRFH